MTKVKILNSAALNIPVQKTSKPLSCDVSISIGWKYNY